MYIVAKFYNDKNEHVTIWQRSISGYGYDLEFSTGLTQRLTISYYDILSTLAQMGFNVK